MAKQTLGIGSTANDGTGTVLRDGGDLINDNFNEIYSKLGDGSSLYSLTFPNATDTVVARNTSETLTNKTIAIGDNTISGTILTFTGDDSTAVSLTVGQDIKFEGGSGITSSVDIATRTVTFATDGSIVTETSSDTLTNKTIAAGDNTITGLTNSNLSGSAGITSANIATGGIANTNLASSHITFGDESSNVRDIDLGQSISFVGGAGITTALTNNILDISINISQVVTPGDVQTLTNKTIGIGQLTTNTRTATGDGSTTAFTVTDGQTVHNVLVFENGVCQEPTTDYSVSGTTLTFETAPASGVKIVIREL